MKTLLTALTLLQGLHLQAEQPIQPAPQQQEPAVTASAIPPETAAKLDELKKAAEQGDASAAQDLAMRYAFMRMGIEARTWGDKYLNILRAKADHGDIDSMVELGKLYIIGNMPLEIRPNNDESRKWFQKAAEAGHPASMYQIARMYKDGYGVEKNSKLADEWYGKAYPALLQLVENNPSAKSEDLYWLALLELNGQGTEKNQEKAFRHLELAAEKGHIYAMYKTARAYERGEGCAQSLDKAHEWLEKGAKQGSVDSMMILAAHYKAGIGVEKDLKRSVEYLQQAAAKNYPPAIYLLSRAYLEGIGVDKDPAKALACTEQLASFGHGQCLLEAALMYIQGIGTAKNEQKAADMLTTAANTYGGAVGALAAYELAKYYTSRDKQDQADTWYIIASERGVPAAMARRGLLHLLPASTLPWNPLRAYKWWEVGAERGDDTSILYRNILLWGGIPLVILLCIAPLFIVARLNRKSLALDEQAARRTDKTDDKH